MATIGSNFILTGRLEARSVLMEKLGLGQGKGRRVPAHSPMVVQKYSATAPTTNAAGDSPGRKGVFCLHYNVAGAFQHVYICTAYTNDSTFTWTQID